MAGPPMDPKRMQEAYQLQMQAQQQAQREHNEKLMEVSQAVGATHPAFPLVLPVNGGVIIKGLTRRELFAAMFLQGMLSSSAPMGDDFLNRSLAMRAVNLADALAIELDGNAHEGTPKNDG